MPMSPLFPPSLLDFAGDEVNAAHNKRDLRPPPSPSPPNFMKYATLLPLPPLLLAVILQGGSAPLASPSFFRWGGRVPPSAPLFLASFRNDLSFSPLYQAHLLRAFSPPFLRTARERGHCLFLERASGFFFFFFFFFFFGGAFFFFGFFVFFFFFFFFFWVFGCIRCVIPFFFLFFRERRRTRRRPFFPSLWIELPSPSPFLPGTTRKDIVAASFPIQFSRSRAFLFFELSPAGIERGRFPIPPFPPLSPPGSLTPA